MFGSSNKKQGFCMSVKALNFQNLPQEIKAEVFNLLDLRSLAKCEQVCKNWQTLINQYPHFQYKKIPRLLSVQPTISSWEKMPPHLGLFGRSFSMRFTHISPELIAFQPYSHQQSTLFYSFQSKKFSFDSCTILLATDKNHFFLTRQSKPSFKRTNLKPLDSYELIIKKRASSNQITTISLLGNLPKTDENLKTCQIKRCFPLTENKVALITSGNKIEFWDIEDSKREGEIEFDQGSKIIRLGNLLVLDKKIIDLNQKLVVDQEFDFTEESLVKGETGFCSYNKKENRIIYYKVQTTKSIEKKWEINDIKTLFEKNNPQIQIQRFKISSMSDKYIAIKGFAEKSILFIILNIRGEVICEIGKELNCNLLEEETFEQFHEDFFVFKNPDNFHLEIHFLLEKHNPLQLDWTKWILGFYSWQNQILIQDILLLDQKLTILLSTYPSAGTIPSKFRILQFNLAPDSKGFLQQSIFKVHELYKNLSSSIL